MLENSAPPSLNFSSDEIFFQGKILPHSPSLNPPPPNQNNPPEKRLCTSP